MTNNYIKVAQYGADGADAARVHSELFPFDDRDVTATAAAYAKALALSGVMSIFRRVPGCELPEIGHGGGFA